MGATMRTFRNIAVFCGSNFGDSDEYAAGARRLGQALAEAGITLIRGGHNEGPYGRRCRRLNRCRRDGARSDH
jgi:predicted Rossmann-fold nucleotide-binding protein